MFELRRKIPVWGQNCILHLRVIQGALAGGDGCLSGYGNELDLAQAKGLACVEAALTNRAAVDESAVGRTAIADDEFAIRQLDLAMRRRDGGVLDLEIVLRSTAQPIVAQLELNHALPKSLRFKQ
jgi:hypothetical protein